MSVHENKRIADLEEHTPDFTDLTDRFKKEGGKMRLFPLQSAALHKAIDAEGAVLNLGCGTGKTLVSMLLAPALNCKKPLLLVPASLRDKTQVEAQVYQQHFEFNIPEVLSYEMLSRQSGVAALSSLAPDIIICDEAHMLKDITSARTQRLGMYLMNNPSTKFVVMSGTLFNKSIADFAHLADWALEGLSPVPRNPRDVYMWDALLSGEAEPYMYGLFTPLSSKYPSLFSARDAVFNRLNSARGVLLTTNDTVPCSLSIKKRSVKMPKELRETINAALNMESPISELLARHGLEDLDFEAINASQHLWDNPDSVMLHTLSQLAMGLIYFWKWDDNTPDTDWLSARKNWRKAVQAILECGLPGFDSPSLILDNYTELPTDVRRAFGNTYDSWVEQSHKPEPPRETVWVSSYLIEDVRKWLGEQSLPCLIWTDCVAFGEKLSEALSIPYYGGGASFDTANAHNCVLSVASHGTGKNLQAWSNNLVVAGIASPATWEQLIARTHRTGQQADTVQFTVYSHSVFGSSFNNAIRQAIIVGEATGQAQRIVYADKI